MNGTPKGTGTYRDQNILTASPARLVAMLYEAAITALRRAIKAIEAGDVKARWRANKRAVEIIEHLLVTLEYRQGRQHRWRPRAALPLHDPPSHQRRSAQRPGARPRGHWAPRAAARILAQARPAGSRRRYAGGRRPGTGCATRGNHRVRQRPAGPRGGTPQPDFGDRLIGRSGRRARPTHSLQASPVHSCAGLFSVRPGIPGMCLAIAVTAGFTPTRGTNCRREQQGLPDGAAGVVANPALTRKTRIKTACCMKVRVGPPFARGKQIRVPTELCDDTCRDTADRCPGAGRDACAIAARRFRPVAVRRFPGGRRCRQRGLRTAFQPAAIGGGERGGWRRGRSGSRIGSDRVRAGVARHDGAEFAFAGHRGTRRRRRGNGREHRDTAFDACRRGGTGADRPL